MLASEYLRGKRDMETKSSFCFFVSLLLRGCLCEVVSAKIIPFGIRWRVDKEIVSRICHGLDEEFSIPELHTQGWISALDVRKVLRSEATNMWLCIAKKGGAFTTLNRLVEDKPRASCSARCGFR